MLYGVHAEYLTLNSDFSIAKDRNGRLFPDHQKVLPFLRKISRKMLITQFILNVIRSFIPKKILPSSHKMLFQRWHDVVRCRKTPHRRWSDVIFLQELVLSIREYNFPKKNFIQHYGHLLYMGSVHLPQDNSPLWRGRLLLSRSHQWKTGIHFINLERMKSWFNLGVDLRGFELRTFGLIFQQRNY